VCDQREQADYLIVLRAFRSVLCVVFEFKCSICVADYGSEILSQILENLSIDSAIKRVIASDCVPVA
jgi:hypothetical protein